MASAVNVKIESDERGFELHLVVDEDVEIDPLGRLVLNVHGVAPQLLAECKRVIGPYVDEMRAAEREYRTSVADDPTQQIVLDRIKHGRGCPCTPCKAEDWDAIDAGIARAHDWPLRPEEERLA